MNADVLCEGFGRKIDNLAGNEINGTNTQINARNSWRIMADEL